MPFGRIWEIWDHVESHVDFVLIWGSFWMPFGYPFGDNSALRGSCVSV